MDPFHERLARVALSELAAFGFCLAGGYAVHSHGLVERPSEDIDLFTSRAHVADFPRAVDAAKTAFEADGLRVEIELANAEFARFHVSDATQRSKVELGVDWRAHPPVQLSVGPVLHVEDAVANKVCALYSRAQARDYIDVDAAANCGRYDSAELTRLAREHDPGFDDAHFALALRAIDRLPVAEFLAYGLSEDEAAALNDRIQRWATAIEDALA